MDIFTPIFIGIVLSLDCLAVSIAAGSTQDVDYLQTALTFAVFFGIFQTGMTLVGWGFGSLFSRQVSSIAYWIAFALLAGVGAKMIFEGVRYEKFVSELSNTHKITAIALLAIATSIDAFVVGTSFAFLGVAVLIPSLIIGVISFFFSLGGVFLSRQLVKIFGKKIEIIGGLILIVIGLNILLSHIYS
ncbi:MAG: manganese efflux pump MntP family protein [Methanoregulaceae archaeon]|jgi:putative Mn2+ efflux pump MntP